MKMNNGDNGYLDDFEAAAKIVADMAEAALKQDHLFTSYAKIHRKTYDALLEVGFSPDEAIQIVSRQGVKLQ